MTTLEQTVLRQLALNALAERTGSVVGARALAAAAKRAYEDLTRVSGPVVGDVGVNALTGRALYLAQRQYPWLVHTREPDQWNGPFDQIVFCLERQDDPAVATEAAGAVLTTLTGLLVTLIGESLTEQLLREAWPDAFSGATTEET